MASRKARQRFHRRDRRKAKESNYRRAPKGNPKKVGHGTSGSIQIFGTTVPAPKPTPKKSRRVPKKHWFDHIKDPPPEEPKSNFGASLVELVDPEILEKLDTDS